MIIGVFGLPRSGKTYWACYNIYTNYIKRGIPVYSNIPLEGAYKINEYNILNGFSFSRGAVLLLDEVQNYANSRKWVELSDTLYFLFSQGGKYDIKLYYTAQDSSRVDKTLREVSNYYIEVSKLIEDDFNRPQIDMKKAGFFKRVLIIDKYKSNYDYSFKKNARRSFSYIRPSFLDKFDSFFAVKSFNSDNKEVKFEKWIMEVKNESI
jgi:hypothetical protein